MPQTIQSCPHEDAGTLVVFYGEACPLCKAEDLLKKYAKDLEDSERELKELEDFRGAITSAVDAMHGACHPPKCDEVKPEDEVAEVAP